MYSVGELAKRFDVSRQTIYNKFLSSELKPFIINNNGAKLEKEGLDILALMLADSKAGQHVTKKIESQRQEEVDTKDNYFDKYVKSLESQIDELKKEKRDMQDRFDILLEQTLNSQKLLESKQDKQRKGIWRIFTRNT